MQNVLYKKDFQAVKEGITYPKGVKAAGVKCGIRFNRKDLALIYSEKLTPGEHLLPINLKPLPWWLLRKIYLFQEGNCRRY